MDAAMADTGKLPAAPFVDSTDKWLGLSLKRVIKLAVDGNYERVAFVNGEQSAERYSLDKQVDKLVWDAAGGSKNSGFLKVFKDGQVINRVEATAQELPSIIGKEVAQKLLDQTPDRGLGERALSGLDLKVEAAGMRGFYDKIVPAAVNTLLKKLGGGRMATVDLKAPYKNSGERNYAVNTFREKMLAKYGDGIMLKMTPEEKAHLRSLDEGGNTLTQPGFDITESIRAAVSDGLPLFSQAAPETRWSDTRIDRLLDQYAYVQDDNRGKAYAGWVRPEAFLAATVPEGQVDLIEAEREPLDRKRLAGETQEIRLDVSFKEGDRHMAIRGHEGRHRMMALRDAGATRVPVAFYVGRGEQQTKQKSMYAIEQKWENGLEAQKGFLTGTLIPINYAHAKELRDTFGGDADISFNQYDPNSFGGFATEAEMLADRARRGAEDTRAKVRAKWPKKADAPPKQDGLRTYDQRTYDWGGFAGMSKEAYDKRRADISFAQVRGSTWNSPEEKRLSTEIYNWQNNNKDLKDITSAIKASGTVLTDRGNAQLRAELYPKRVAARIKNFERDEIYPLFAEMQAAKVSIIEIGEYLHARHAEERNIEMQARNLNRVDNEALSGMETAEARKILAAARPAMKRLAARVDTIIQKSRQLRVDAGLETQDTVDRLTNSFQFYAPLHRDDAHPDHIIGTGQGFAVKGKTFKAATGSNATVDHATILAHIISEREMVITKAEKNLVSMALYHMALNNPNPDWWKPDTPPTEGVLDTRVNVFNPGTGTMMPNPNKGQVVFRVPPNYKNDDHILPLKVNGQDRTITFNNRNPRALRMAMALKNMDVAEVQGFIKYAGIVTRFMSAMLTKYSPVFAFVNAIRDVQGAAINLTSTEINGAQLEILNPFRLAKIAREIKRMENGQAPKDQHWADVYKDFRFRGGQTGYKAMYENINDRAKALKDVMARMEGGSVAAKARAYRDYVGVLNDAIENMIRVSTYQAALDRGVSKDKAASISGNITVNFNMRGAAKGQAASSMYMFFNAAVQGNTRTLEALRGKHGNKIIAGGITLGILQALLLEMVLDDDEEERVPEWVKMTSWVIPYTRDDGKHDYVAIPMPLGLHVLPNIGRLITEAGIDYKKGEKINVIGSVFHLFGTLFSAMSPLGSGESGMQLIMPTVFDPAVALWENKNGLGSPIYKERGQYDEGAPGYLMGRESTNPVYKGIAYGVHMAFNGMDPYERNTTLDPWTSPQPEAIRFIPETIGGGLWRDTERMLDTLGSVAGIKDVPRNRMILLSRFAGDLHSDQAPMDMYYKNLDAVAGAKYGVRRADKDGVVRESPLAAMASRAGEVQQEMRTLIESRRELALEDGSELAIKEIEGEMAEIMREFNAEVREARRGQ